MTASHTTHRRGTKRRKTSVPDWSIHPCREQERRKNYVTKVGRFVEIKMQHDGQRGEKKGEPSHIVLESDHADRGSYATRH